MSVQNHTVTQYSTAYEILRHAGGLVMDTISESAGVTSTAVLFQKSDLKDHAYITDAVTITDVTVFGSAARITDRVIATPNSANHVIRQNITLRDKVRQSLADSFADIITFTAFVPPEEFQRVVSTCVGTSTATGFTTRDTRWADTIRVSGGVSNSLSDTFSDTANAASITYARLFDSIADILNGTATVIDARTDTAAWQDEVIFTSRAKWGEGTASQVIADTAHLSSRVSTTTGKDVLVMNSNTGAISRYDDADIVMALQTPTGVVYITPDGMAYADFTADVPASVTYSPTDYGRKTEFRYENLWLDLEGGADMTAQFTTHGATPTSYTYPIESRGTSVPRSTRFVPGRGMVGRFWGVRLAGTAPFRVFKLAMDLAESRRRV